MRDCELRIVSCPGGGVWIAITRDFEHDICVTSEILQSDWTLPNRAPVPRKSTKVPRPSFRVGSGHENINLVWVTLMLLHTYVWICHIIRKGLQYACIITTYHMRSLKKLSMTTYIFSSHTGSIEHAHLSASRCGLVNFPAAGSNCTALVLDF